MVIDAHGRPVPCASRPPAEATPASHRCGCGQQAAPMAPVIVQRNGPSPAAMVAAGAVGALVVGAVLIALLLSIAVVAAAVATMAVSVAVCAVALRGLVRGSEPPATARRYRRR